MGFMDRYNQSLNQGMTALNAFQSQAPQMRSPQNFGNNVFSNTAPNLQGMNVEDFMRAMAAGIDPNKVNANANPSAKIQTRSPVAPPAAPQAQGSWGQQAGGPAPDRTIMGMYGGGIGSGPLGQTFMTSANQGQTWNASQQSPNRSPWTQTSNDIDGSQWQRGQNLQASGGSWMKGR